MDRSRAFMVKVEHKGSKMGHTFISIDYSPWEVDAFNDTVDKISKALRAPDGSNMPKTPAVSYRIQKIRINWQGAFGEHYTLTELTPTNCRAVFQCMAGAKHPYNLEVVFEESEELPPYSSEEKGRSMTKADYFALRESKKPF